MLARTSVAGAAAGVFDLAGCLAEGRRAAAAALDDLGVAGAGGASDASRRRATDRPAHPPWCCGGCRTPAGPPAAPQFVDLQRDATVADIARAVDAGMRTVEHIKRYTTIGTAHDQGKTSGVIASGITAELLGRPIEELGTTTFRPPYTPVAFAALAGRNRGSLFDPERTTAVHAWHLARGAVWEDVGQWKRPRYYPQPGEDMETAVLRECAAVRGGVGILDGSTLGKIDVQGPDAAAFLDLLYTNMMSSLKVGSIRYGVMCRTDGMVLDDGTVLRLDQDRFLVYTTTGGAAGGPRVDGGLAADRVAAPARARHLGDRAVGDVPGGRPPVAGRRRRGDRTGHLEGGVPVHDVAGHHGSADVRVRVARVSFSGELAFEVNVDAWHAPAVWERLIAAGEPYGITPYGTETMHVLRAEKAYPIIGQDTDGTVTPQDLGMSWAVSKKKPDFLGKRSFARADNSRPDRKHLVGLLPVDRTVVLPEGSQIVEGPTLPEPPVPMLGHVTSSYRSAELDRSFALALVKARPDPHRADGARARRGGARPRGDHRARPRRPRRSPS